MAFKSKRERYVFVQGIRAGNKGAKPYKKGGRDNVTRSEFKSKSSVGHSSFSLDDFAVKIYGRK